MKNYNKANQIMEIVAKNNPFITPITNDDITLFQSFFKKESHSYANSWSYIIQQMYGVGKNNLGYKYYDGKNLSAVCIHPKIEQPDLNAFYWIRPMGPEILDVIDRLSKKIFEEQSIPIYVKKLFSHQYQYLKKKGFKETDGFPWHSTCPSEDDTFPEQIYAPESTLNLLKQPPRTSNIRKSYRKVAILYRTQKIIFSKEEFKERAWTITGTFFQQKKKNNISKLNDYYNIIFNNISPNIFFDGFCMDDQPYGYYLGERQDDQYSSIYALFTLKDKISYISDLLIFYLFQHSPTSYVNLGGSENLGLHNFKKKYKPVKELQMYWVSLY
jgi:hypothetical protein